MGQHRGFFVVATLGLAVFGGVAATTTTASAKKSNKPTLVMITSQTNSSTSRGTQQLVTNQDVKALVMTDPDTQSAETVVIPKNTALTVLRKQAGGDVVRVAGSDQQLLINEPAQITYSNRAIKLTKTDYQRLVKQSKAWAGKLSAKQVKVVGDYTGDAYEQMNAALRDPNKPASKQTQRRVRSLQTSLKSFKLTKPLTVYRGTSKMGLKLSVGKVAVKPGVVYQDAAFSSTSLNTTIAKSFASKVILKINLPVGYHGAYIDPISANKGEKEYLLNPGVKLVVTKIQTVKARTTTHLYVKTKKHATNHTEHENYTYQLVTLNLMQ
ncbi:ADP-ribosyltransferase [Levilactobacillus koreensis]|uniref:ADP-ribosyltransferase n=1 Tax=Levilactobacillus koreensis TaxID=637971 RepID=UPI0006614F15|nr:ADP-ribosyltransferase [Levilactobacillus koreensis]